MARNSVPQIPLEKECPKCKITKPISQFYVNLAMPDGHQYSCIECDKIKARKHRVNERKNRPVPGRTSEGYLIQYLREKGIYAAPGKCSEWLWVDVIAFGCVRIESKYSNRPNGVFEFKMSRHQRLYGLDADIVVFTTDDDIQRKFHFFWATDHVVQQMLTRGVLPYQPNAKRRNTKGRIAALTPELMEPGLDRFDLVWQQFERVQDTLKRGEPL